MRLSTLVPAVLAGTFSVALAVAVPYAGTASAATPATTTDPAKVGLYGSQDPTFDGVYRQSLALLSLAADGKAPAAEAVTWLLDQQCADGGFQSFRADLAKPCSPPSSSAFSGEDTNSTGLAVQALHALGKVSQAGRAVDWLVAHLGPDGGWAYYPDGAAGNASDANSTALSLSAVLAVGRSVPSAGGHTPYDALQALQVGCEGAVAQQGAFTFFGTANDYATVQATVAMAGAYLPVQPATLDNGAPIPTCPAAKAKKGATPRSLVGLTPAQSADDASGYLVRRLAANANVIPDPFNPGQTDWSSTANAVLALVATRHGSTQVAAALANLAGGQASYTTKNGADLPASLAILALAAHAGGGDPSAFGGTDLLRRLAATVTTAAASPTPTASSSHPTATATATASVAPTSAEADPTLPATGAGAGTGGILAVALALLVLGSGLVAVSRRLVPAGRHEGRAVGPR
jgi:hypothetical protein